MNFLNFLHFGDDLILLIVKILCFDYFKIPFDVAKLNLYIYEENYLYFNFSTL
jgi:hypothetical protein